MNHGEITLKDLARQLKISPSTVSRALKDHPEISSKTKLAVTKLAKELNYRLNCIEFKKKSNQYKLELLFQR